MITPPLHLSPRQIEVSILVAAGCSDKGVARELDLSPSTAKKQIRLASDRIRRSFPHYVGTHRDVIRRWYIECRFYAFHAKRGVA